MALRMSEWFVGAFMPGLRLLILSMFLLLSTDVVVSVAFRYVLNSPLTWTDELARFMLIWIVFFGAAIPFEDWSHFAVEVFVRRLPLRLQRIIRLLVYALVLVFLVIVLWYGGLLAWLNMAQRSPALQIPFAPIYAAIPVGALLMMAIVARDVLRLLFEGAPAPDFAAGVTGR
jgi:TRAP-type C4-dicarboxylate transport system permease small subunit